ncbi:hypothetical protein LPJ66_003013 [Kickxella alabastrina]|uniref:Uncharacterized protein n=1 Tax=Kickxella alabastrina TaxID=61397 RepID=A0ACC1ILU5_9FUNG|nr:hypothetical protein LPJ66_003013 [Kickxella alabastrina]
MYIILGCIDGHDIFGYRIWPVNESYGKYTFDHLVRSLRLVIDYCTLKNGSALERLKELPYKNMVFENAHTLNLVFGDCYCCKYAKQADVENLVEKHVLAIKAMAPNMRNIFVESRPDNTGLDGRVSGLYDIVPLLLNGAKKPMFSLGDSRFIEFVNAESFPGLTHLAFGGDIDDERIIELVHSNSATLENLEMKFIRNGNAAHLARTSNGAWASFPCLQKLHLKRKSKGVSVEEVALTEAVMFPSLQWLTIEMEHPFGDDTIFRGNADTLKYIDMQVDTPTLDMVSRCGVFAKGRYRKLNYVSLKPVRLGGTGINVSPSQLSSIAMAMAAGSQSLNVNLFDLGREVIHYIKESPSVRDIRVLNMTRTKLSLFDIIYLVRQLPILVEIGVQYSGTGAEFDELSPGDFPDYVHAQYRPLGRYLDCLNQDHNGTDSNAERIATCAMLMAIMCPNMTLATVPDNFKDGYTGFIEQALTKTPFGKYADRLKFLTERTRKPIIHTLRM